MIMKEKTDVLFIYTNVNGFHSDVYSFGIGYLSSVLKNNGFSTGLVIVRSRKDYKKVLAAALEHRPAVVGFSSVSSQFVFVSELAKMIKKVHDCIVVCGGVHPTIFPDCLISVPYFDGIFIGESEHSFTDFVSKVTRGDRYKDVNNFCYADTSKLVKNRLSSRLENLEMLPFPDRDIYEYQSVIDENDGMATIMTSRGCPFRCTYCSNLAIAHIYGKEKNSIRHNSVENSIREIDMLKSKYKFDRLWIIDDLFTLDRQWLGEFLLQYRKNFQIPFICQIRPNVCSRDILRELKDAGCVRILVAIESANDHIRNSVMKRGVTKAQLENSFEWAKEIGLETLSANIIGTPGETEETILETINFNKRMNPTVVGVNIFSPYEGTELGDYCREKGLLRKTNARSFFDRRQPRLALPTITDRKLVSLYDRFQYLVYKDTDPLKAKELLRQRRYEKIEETLLFGYLFKEFRKAARLVVKKLKITK